MAAQMMKSTPAFLMAVTAAAGEGDLPRNFHQVDAENRIFRSAQPDREEFLELERRGFRPILNLRNFHSNRRKIRGLKLREFPVPCNAGSMTEAHLARALQILRDEPKPLLIHCWHGSDRTGTVVAAFRIVFNGWETEAAIGEMCREEYGHHAGTSAVDRLGEDALPSPVGGLAGGTVPT